MTAPSVHQALADYGINNGQAGQAVPATVDRRREVLQIAEYLEREIRTVRWRCDGFLPGEGFALIVGAEKEGKSLAALQLGLCIAGGLPYMGRAVEAAGVLLIEEEGGDASMQDRITRQAEKLGLLHQLAELPLHLAVRQRFRLDTEADIAQIEAELLRTGAKVVILSPLSQLAVVDENRPSEMNAMLRPLLDLAARLSILIVLVHHRRKSDQKAGPPKTIREFFDSIRGTNALAGAVDAAIGIRREPTDSEGVLYLLLRDGPGERCHFSFEANSLTIWPTEAPVPSYDRAPLDEVERAVVGHGEPVPRSWVAAQLGVSPTTARDRLEVLVADGRLAHVIGPRNTVLYAQPRAAQGGDPSPVTSSKEEEVTDGLTQATRQHLSIEALTSHSGSEEPLS